MPYIPQVNQVTIKNVTKNDNARARLGNDNDGAEVAGQNNKRNNDNLPQNTNVSTSDTRQSFPDNEVNVIKINRRFERHLSESSSNEEHNNKSINLSTAPRRDGAERYMEIIHDQNYVSL